MEKKFILTLHIAESELGTLAGFFHGRASAYTAGGDKLNELRCNTNLHLLRSNMDKKQQEQYDNDITAFDVVLKKMNDEKV